MTGTTQPQKWFILERQDWAFEVELQISFGFIFNEITINRFGKFGVVW